MLPADHLPTEWREKAKELRRFGAEEQALTLECCAVDLEAELRLWREEPLTLAEAADVSGYSADHLGRLVREGKIPNLGRPGAPAVARRDLPLKPKRRIPVALSKPRAHASGRQIVQSIINGER